MKSGNKNQERDRDKQCDQNQEYYWDRSRKQQKRNWDCRQDRSIEKTKGFIPHSCGRSWAGESPSRKKIGARDSNRKAPRKTVTRPRRADGPRRDSKNEDLLPFAAAACNIFNRNRGVLGDVVWRY
ncbi:hypothetical protein EVAR_34276_1 [Eumeta japonica]|uniref:Uncharacterized protein n=1 Tax=Eumeta variegata TaxID=151549 RepID=A0A4C1VXM8_EUMVA|nr:hypothetical protein EVAR_34276_1 [Eumeta japonica]